jgi:hypothetical protein
MSNKKINIIYFIPSYKKPSGGSMVAYNHSRIINSLKKINISSQILHYKKKRSAKLITSLKKIFKIRNYKNEFGYKPNEIKVVKNFHPLNNWVNYKLAIKNDLKFDKQNDFIILPEIIAHFADEFFIKNKIKYAIFLQGIYHMHQTSNIKLLKKSNITYMNLACQQQFLCDCRQILITFFSIFIEEFESSKSEILCMKNRPYFHSLFFINR